MAISDALSRAVKGPLAQLGDALSRDAGRVERWLGLEAAPSADKWVGATAGKAAKALPKFEQRTFLQKVEYAGMRLVSRIARTFGRFVPAPIKELGYRFMGLFQPVANSPVVGNLGKLSDRLFRGQQLGSEGFKTLKKMGVDTVINLAPEQNLDPKLAEALGMKAIAIPEPPFGEPTMAQGVEFLEAATDPANGKVYFHCYHGSDRTGAMAAIYRILDQGWSVNRALAEMPKYHFHAGIEDAKLKFVKDFVDYWKTLPKSQQNQILHKAA